MRPPDQLQNRNAAGASRGVGDRHHSGSIRQPLDKPIPSALQASIFTASHQGELRNAQRTRLARHLWAAGVRPLLEAMLELADGKDLDDVLDRYARIPVETYDVLGADAFPPLAVINGGRA
jgi:hypothetical protein